jgi:pimeloyl-ACP methyl ester carboxylesterase
MVRSISCWCLAGFRTSSFGGGLGWSAFLQRLMSFSRLIMFDKRGTGLSDRVSVREMPTLEERMDDVRAVMDAVGSKAAFVVGPSEGGPTSLLFAASHPERTRALVLYGGFPRITSGEGYRWGFAPEQIEPLLALAERSWGDGMFTGSLLAPGDLPARLGFFARFEREGARPGAMMRSSACGSRSMCGTSCRRFPCPR